MTDTRAPKSSMRKSTVSAAELVRRAVEEHPEVSLVLKIASQVRALEEYTQPVELDEASDLTLTPTVSQLPW